MLLLTLILAAPLPFPKPTPWQPYAPGAYEVKTEHCANSWLTLYPDGTGHVANAAGGPADSEVTWRVDENGWLQVAYYRSAWTLTYKAAREGGYYARTVRRLK
jgi:hypothetical protein